MAYISSPPGKESCFGAMVCVSHGSMRLVTLMTVSSDELLIWLSNIGKASMLAYLPDWPSSKDRRFAMATDAALRSPFLENHSQLQPAT